MSQTKNTIRAGNRVALYTRYSPGKNQQDLSIEGQLRVCMDYCKERGYEVVGSYVDRKQSGRYDTRKDLQRLMDDVPRGIFDIVVVYKLSRFFRNRTEAALYRKMMREHGVKYLSVSEQIPAGRGGIYYEAILEAEAEAYSVGLSEDVQRGMYDTALKGMVLGPLPYGYVSVPATGDYRDRGRKMQIDPVASQVVRRAFAMYLEGYSLADIGHTFTNEGLRNRRGGKFNVNNLSIMLRNEKYAGIYRYKGEVLNDVKCPAIVDKRVFEEVNRRLEGTQKKPQRGRAAVEFSLTSKIYCGHCSNPMFGDSGVGRAGKKYYYYSCSSRRRGLGCEKSPVPKELLEETVLQAAIEQLTPENISIISQETEAVAKKESQNAQILEGLNKEMSKVETEILHISKAIAQGIITETTKEMLENAEAYRADLRMRIKHEQLIASTLVTKESVAAFLGTFAKGDRSSTVFRRKVFDLLVREVYVYDGDDTNCGHVVVWCNVGKGIKVTRNLFDESAKLCSDTSGLVGLAGFEPAG